MSLDTLKVCCNGEVRRLRDVPTEFEELRKLLQDRFALPSNYSIVYKDEDGDLITITTSDELLEAIRVCEENGMKSLRVEVLTPAAKPEEPAEAKPAAEAAAAAAAAPSAAPPPPPTVESPVEFATSSSIRWATGSPFKAALAARGVFLLLLLICFRIRSRMRVLRFTCMGAPTSMYFSQTAMARRNRISSRLAPGAYRMAPPPPTRGAA
mmetsp:Transcript_13009/g.21400  ORF Transcript_13009/g.21400 Transcript_13009/m.21400 type:complete len:210 (+) Transcript_13009:226-855(+)